MAVFNTSFFDVRHTILGFVEPDAMGVYVAALLYALLP